MQKISLSLTTLLILILGTATTTAVLVNYLSNEVTVAFETETPVNIGLSNTPGNYTIGPLQLQGVIQGESATYYTETAIREEVTSNVSGNRTIKLSEPNGLNCSSIASVEIAEENNGTYLSLGNPGCQQGTNTSLTYTQNFEGSPGDIMNHRVTINLSENIAGNFTVTEKITR